MDTLSPDATSAGSSSPTADSANVRVAYLVSKYPAISHTFIEREVLALRAAGAEVHTFSVRPCPDSELKSEAMRAEAASTTVLIDDVRNAYPRAHAKVLRAAPKAWAATLARAARSGDVTAKARLWQSFYFAEAVVLFEEMRSRGLRHVHVHFPNVSADVARLTVHLGRLVDGPDAGWRWSMSIHGPTEFEAVDRVDLPAKVRSADGIACISDFARSQLMRLVGTADWPKMKLVRMSVDANVYLPPADERAGREGQPLRVLYVGRLVPEKGSPVLLDAVRQLRERGVDVEVRLVGSGELEADLRAEIARHGLDGVVTLAGAIGQDELPQWYHWADVFCLPSFQEGLPVVLMEALATELPVVTTRIAAIEELVVDGEMGHVVAPGRADALADALAHEASDPELRRRQGRAGRQAVLREFTPSSTSTAMLRFLAGVQPSGH